MTQGRERRTPAPTSERGNAAPAPAAPTSGSALAHAEAYQSALQSGAGPDAAAGGSGVAGATSALRVERTIEQAPDIATIDAILRALENAAANGVGQLELPTLSIVVDVAALPRLQSRAMERRRALVAATPNAPGPRIALLEHGANGQPPGQAAEPESPGMPMFRQLQAESRLRNFLLAIETFEPVGNDQISLFTREGQRRSYGRPDAEQIREGVRRELDHRIGMLETMIGAVTDARLDMARRNAMQYTHPLDFDRMGRELETARAEVRALRAMLGAGHYVQIAQALGGTAAKVRAVEQLLHHVRDNTGMAEWTTYGLEFVRDASLAIFAVAAVAATGAVGGAVLAGAAAAGVELVQQGSEVGQGLRSQVSSREVLVRGLLAGLSSLASSGAATIAGSAGGRMLLADMERIIIDTTGVSQESAHSLAEWGFKKLVKWAVDQLRTNQHIGTSDITGVTGVSARTSSTSIPNQINSTVRGALPHAPAPVRGVSPEGANGMGPNVPGVDALLRYLQTIDYEKFVREQARTWVRDQTTNATGVRGQTPARPNAIDAIVGRRLATDQHQRSQDDLQRDNREGRPGPALPRGEGTTDTP